MALYMSRAIECIFSLIGDAIPAPMNVVQCDMCGGSRGDAEKFYGWCGPMNVVHCEIYCGSHRGRRGRGDVFWLVWVDECCPMRNVWWLTRRSGGVFHGRFSMAKSNVFVVKIRACAVD